MSFDLRWPIGLLFVIFGLILAVDGAIARRLVLGINVNLWWGVVMIVFGGLMIAMARRGASRPGARPASGRPRAHGH